MAAYRVVLLPFASLNCCGAESDDNQEQLEQCKQQLQACTTEKEVLQRQCSLQLQELERTTGQYTVHCAAIACLCDHSVSVPELLKDNSRNTTSVINGELKACQIERDELQQLCEALQVGQLRSINNTRSNR